MAQENKQQLQVMGERLARASQDNKAAEIQHKLSKVSERWQHLLDLIAARWVAATLQTQQKSRQRWCILEGAGSRVQGFILWVKRRRSYPSSQPRAGGLFLEACPAWGGCHGVLPVAPAHMTARSFSHSAAEAFPDFSCWCQSGLRPAELQAEQREVIPPLLASFVSVYLSGSPDAS